MPSVYALFVAINEYPNPKDVLKGCVYDMHVVFEYLKTHCEQVGMELNSFFLINEQATRSNVIAGFEHFNQAETDSPCVFYFAGHGARSAAPEAFWHLEPDHLCDSIVCWDSRLPGGRDIMDKELSYLVWRASQGKNLPFITITDCCHSGNLRDIVSNDIRTRSHREIGVALQTEEYTGIEHYKRINDNQLSPPQGRRIHLAASRDVETAKEIQIEGRSHGIFSYCLVETLRQYGPFISYMELMNRLHLRIKGRIRDQSPQLSATFADDKKLCFLSGVVGKNRALLLISYDRIDGWTVNAGAIHGVTAGDLTSRTILYLPEIQKKVEIADVFTDYSSISGMENSDINRIYAAELRRLAIPLFDIIPAGDADLACFDQLTDLLYQKPSALFRLQKPEETERAVFCIHTTEELLWLSYLNETQPLFQPIVGYSNSSLTSFVDQVEQVISWQHVLDLSNPLTQIPDEDVTIELFRITDPGNLTDEAPAEAVNWQSGPVTFSYLHTNDKWIQPAFRLKFRNNSNRALWLGLLYLGNDFSISDALMSKEMLGSGQETWAYESHETFTYRTIPLYVNKSLSGDDRTFIEEYLKVMISTDGINTDLFCQEGIEPHQNLRNRRRFHTPEEKDWTTRLIKLRIGR